MIHRWHYPGGRHKPKKWLIVSPRRERPAIGCAGSRSLPPWPCYTLATRSPYAPERSFNWASSLAGLWTTFSPSGICKKMVDSPFHLLIHTCYMCSKPENQPFFHYGATSLKYLATLALSASQIKQSSRAVFMKQVSPSVNYAPYCLVP